MKMEHVGVNGFQEILEQKQAELTQVLRDRDGIVIERSADQMDEVQHASEREFAIRTADRESNLLRDVKAALRRVRDGSFGVCVECERAINPKRLAAVPWAECCVLCQQAADMAQSEGTDSFNETFADAA